MLTENEIVVLHGPLREHFMQLEKDIVNRVCKHIGKIGELTETDVHMLDELQMVGFNMKYIQREIENILDMTEKEILNIFSKASEIEYNGVKGIYDLTGTMFVPFDQNERLTKLIHNIANVTYKKFSNISNTGMIGFRTAAGKFEPLDSFYIKTVDYAILQAHLGQANFYGAMRRSVTTMARDGLLYTEYGSGYIRRLDSSVRMNILGGLARLSHEQSAMIWQEIGADGYEITWHSGYRPTHDFGGEQFDIKEYENRILPLMREPNCYHRSFAVVLRVSIPTYSKQELDAMNAAELEEHYFEGKGYNAYEAQQKQRKYELAIRQQKDLVNAFDSAGDTEAAGLARAKLHRLNQSYAKFSQSIGLPINKTRIVGTFGRGTISEKNIPTVSTIKPEIPRPALSKEALEGRKKLKEIFEAEEKAGRSGAVSVFDAIEDIVKSRPVVIQEYYYSGAKDFKGFFGGERNDAHYVYQDHKIVMNLGRTAKDKEGAYYTWFHEYGHLLDHNGSGFNWFSFSDVDFIKAIKTDYKNLLTSNGTKIIPEIDTVFLKDVNTAGIQDMISGMSLNKIDVSYAHENKHWLIMGKDKTPNLVAMEMVADFTHGLMNDAKGAILDQYVPNAWKYFKDALMPKIMGK